jgi:hypothetical protein
LLFFREREKEELFFIFPEQILAGCNKSKGKREGFKSRAPRSKEAASTHASLSVSLSLCHGIVI